jgi:Uncharacterized ACR, COG1753.
MATADEQIRVTETVKEELDQRRREGESYNDVLERLVKDDRDLFAGFGMWSDEKAQQARERRQANKEKRKRRMRGENE